MLKVFGAISIVPAYLSAFTDRTSFWTTDGDATCRAGIAVYVIGEMVRLWPVYVLKNWFCGLVAIRWTHARLSGWFSSISAS